MLLVTLGAVLATLPNVSNSHPRLWLTTPRLARLKVSAAQNAPRWVQLKALADRLLTSRDSDPENIPPLGLAYQVTGINTYARAAIQRLLNVAVPGNTLEGDSYYGYRSVLPDVCAGFDWCYGQMTTVQRHKVAKWLMDRADAVWPETTPARRSGWAVTMPANNYYYGFLMTWPAALAAFGDEPRAAAHLKLALSKYRNSVRPLLDSWGGGGVFAESTNYDSTFRLGLILDAHHTATGQDLVHEPGFAFLRDSILWRIYATVPMRDAVYLLGDQPRISLATLSPYDRERMLAAMADLPDTTIERYGKFWLDTITTEPRRSWDFTITWEILFYDDKVPSTDYTKKLPLFYFAPGPGLLVGRSDWSPAATYWGIWSGPLRESHQNRDVNGFLIFKGGWLVGNDTLWSHSGILSETHYQNNLTFGGLGQTWQAPEARWPQEAGKVLKSEQKARFAYLEGSGAQAYVQDRSHDGVRVAQEYVRKFVYLAPDQFFVYDRATLVSPSLSKEWHLHSPKPITVRGRTYSWDNGAYRLVGQSLLPATGVTVQSVPVAQGASNAVSSYRLDVNAKNNRATDTLLNVLQIFPIASHARFVPQVITVDSGNMEGALSGGWAVLFGKAEVTSRLVSYRVSAPDITQHLILDLLPQTRYHIAATNSAGSVMFNSNVPSSSQGALNFTLPAGSLRIVLSPSVSSPRSAR